MKRLYEKIGLVLASTLILASMFGGVAMANTLESKERQNQQLYTSVAFELALSDDFVATFKSMPQETQDKVSARLKVLNKQMELADDIFAFYYSLTPAEQVLIDLDSINLEGVESSYHFNSNNHAFVEAYANDDESITSSVSGNCHPTSCKFYGLHQKSYYGTLSNDTHFTIIAYVYFTHGSEHITHDSYSTDIIVLVYGGWTCEYKDPTPSWTKTRPYQIIGNQVYDDIIVVCYKVRCGRLFTKEWGAGAFGAALDINTGDHFTPTTAQWAPLSNSNNFNFDSLGGFVIEFIKAFFDI